MTVVPVPAYSPHAVADHTIALLLGIVRKTHRAHARVREGNFSLDGLLGLDLHGRTVGVIGTGSIGAIVVRILTGLGCRILAYDPFPNDAVRALGAAYLSSTRSGPPPTSSPSTVRYTRIAPIRLGRRHRSDEAGRKPHLARSASRHEGGHPRTQVRRIGGLGLDVYEEEGPLFFEDRSGEVIQDDIFMRLLTFPNVLVTGHQAFFTSEALHAIAETSLSNLDDCAAGRPCPNRVD